MIRCTLICVEHISFVNHHDKLKMAIVSIQQIIDKRALIQRNKRVRVKQRFQDSYTSIRPLVKLLKTDIRNNQLRECHNVASLCLKRFLFRFSLIEILFKEIQTKYNYFQFVRKPVIIYHSFEIIIKIQIDSAINLSFGNLQFEVSLSRKFVDAIASIDSCMCAAIEYTACLIIAVLSKTKKSNIFFHC